MNKKVIKRLPQVRTLFEILPKGTEGGKEFARIIDLLLFNEAQKEGKKITIFNDSAGDYRGLDSFQGDVFRKAGTIGYQYKFYPSPLSPKHRENIEKSLKRVCENHKDLKLSKWILITPQDFIESANRKDGGDVTWFETLRKKLGIKFEVEHWGHNNLIALFLQTSFLCLYYYPELVPDGSGRRKTFQDIYKRYNRNLNTLYNNIEFVGMSVYKPEATDGIPMEDIYIPLTVIPLEADENDDRIQRINPLSFLEQCDNYVVLGDPGSGKSILLRFLSLSVSSKQLQERYKAKSQQRLPVLITLRSYADELKARIDLSLIDYILENIQGDFSLKDADLNFFEYYLETGQTILLFDGLDELPNPHFKKIVRDRIRTLITTYPGNMSIVTSRIVGYDNPFRFNDKEFMHYRLTKLRLSEMEQFVKDWYKVRIENKKDRDANADDLIQILRDKDYYAIHELAQNPLLLTIVALVHRIDAVLPHERIVLYQKCTETLLNTWHTWKYREAVVKSRGKVERRNRRRIEAIANWMHTQSGGISANQRAIVPYDDLKNFLIEHIKRNEKNLDSDNEPQDIAVDFLDFIKNRAGLLIEIGDNKYSFVHLTFQEYLTASYIITSNEMEGVSGIWEIIKKQCTDSRWHEVIRLLISELKSITSQSFLIDKILSEQEICGHVKVTLLLGGLILDGIESAEERKKEIFTNLLNSSISVTDIEQLRPLISILSNCLIKSKSNTEVIKQIFESQFKLTADNKQKIAITLVAKTLNRANLNIVEFTSDYLNGEHRDAVIFNLFFSEKSEIAHVNSIQKNIDYLWSLQNSFSLVSSYLNFVAVTFQSINFSLGSKVISKRAFMEQLFITLNGEGLGPFKNFNANSLSLNLNNPSHTYSCLLDLDLAQDLALDRDWVLAVDLARDLARARSSAREVDQTRDQPWGLAKARHLALARVRDLALALDLALYRDLDWDHDMDRSLDRALARARLRSRDRDRDRARALALARKSDKNYWQTVLTAPLLYIPILDSLCDAFNLTPRIHWFEALRTGFIPNLHSKITLYDESLWLNVVSSFEKKSQGESEIYFAAWQLLFDSWLYVSGHIKSREESFLNKLEMLTREIDEPPIRIAHCIRNLAYGDKSQIDELALLVKSDTPQYRKIFEECLWRLTPEEELSEKEFMKSKFERK